MPPHETPSQPTLQRLLGHIAELKGNVAVLQAQKEELEDERDQLLRENRALRRKLTHAQLADGLLTTLDETGPSPDSESSSPVRELYEALPSRFSFPTFFEVAETGGLDTDTARRCLRHFLKRDLLYQEGRQLTKAAPSVAAA